MEKRGLSPVVATILLIAMVIVIALFIFLWARSFLAERVEKFDEPVENACERINFEAEAISNVVAGATEGMTNVSVINRGNVPIYGLEIRRRGIGTIQSVGAFEGTTNAIRNGETGTIVIYQRKARDPAPEPDKVVRRGDALDLYPIILGRKRTDHVPFTCDREYAQTITVGAL